MNIVKHFQSSWIIILNCFLLLLLIIQFNRLYIDNTIQNKLKMKYINEESQVQGFMNYPEQVDTTKFTPSNPDKNQAQLNYTELLQFISKNPQDGMFFVEDMRKKFFDVSCDLKKNIRFSSLVSQI